MGEVGGGRWGESGRYRHGGGGDGFYAGESEKHTFVFFPFVFLYFLFFLFFALFLYFFLFSHLFFWSFLFWGTGGYVQSCMYVLLTHPARLRLLLLLLSTCSERRYIHTYLPTCTLLLSLSLCI